MEYKDLQKMTVKALREEAQKQTSITGITGMKKDELVAALAEALGIEKPKKEKKAATGKHTKESLKGEIKKFKELRAKALEDKDRIALKKARFHIKRLKRALRKLA